MAAPEGWTIVSEPEKNNGSIVSISRDHVVKDIDEYFDEVGEFVRKCKLCSREIRLNVIKSRWNLKTHLMSKHPAEWAKLEPFLKKLGNKKKSNVTANANDFELIKEEPNHFDDEYENMDPNEFDQNESVPAKSQMDDPTGAKRAKLMDELTNDEFTLFGFFVANELRNLKTAHFRGELKRAIQKCLFEVAEKEAATTAVEHN